jgi:hypothetical protein
MASLEGWGSTIELHPRGRPGWCRDPRRRRVVAYLAALATLSGQKIAFSEFHPVDTLLRGSHVPLVVRG